MKSDDRKLLELAAKAIGLEYGKKVSRPITDSLYLGPDKGWWNPLIDRDDARSALKMAVERITSADARIAELEARLSRLLCAAELVTRWDWSDNDADCVHDIQHLREEVDVVRAGNGGEV